MSLLCAQEFPRSRVQAGPTQGQRAAFLNEALWPTLATLRIYFFPLPPMDKLQQIKWQNPQLPKQFLDPLYEQLQNKVDPYTLVRKVVEERIAPLVGLTFVFTDDIRKSDIRIIFGPEYGCSSVVGNTKYTNPTEPTMTFGWYDVATVIHEFCHALGMIHEHQNPQGNPIQWNDEAIYCYYRYTQNWPMDQVKRNILDTYKLDQTNGSNFDDRSIMIYPFNETLQCRLCQPLVDSDQSLCGARSLPTTLNGQKIEPVYKMSPNDIRWLEIMYPKDGKRDMNLIRNLDKGIVQSPTIPTPKWLDVQNPEGLPKFFQDNWKKIALIMVVIFLVWIVL